MKPSTEELIVSIAQSLKEERANYAEERANYAEERANNRHFQQIVLSELSLLKQGIIIIGGKAVSDLYGITEQTKDDWQIDAQAFSQSTTTEEMGAFVQECHQNPQFRKQAVSLGEIAKSWNPTITTAERQAFGKWVSIQWAKMFGIRPAVQISGKAGARKQSRCYYPPNATTLLESMAGYFFSERTDLLGDLPKRTY